MLLWEGTVHRKATMYKAPDETQERRETDGLSESPARVSLIIFLVVPPSPISLGLDFLLPQQL